MRLYLAVILAVLGAMPVLAANPAPVDQSWEILEAGAKDKSFIQRSHAIQALGLLCRNPEAVILAENALHDDAPEVRAAAATALGQMQAKSSIPKLQEALDDKDFSVVLAAAHSLRLLKENDSFETYYEILTGERKGQE